MNLNKISIVMPALNEAKIIGDTLGRLSLSEGEDLIVVDGGSTDDTVSIARQFTDKVYAAKTGRARVMNFGAEKASGGMLLFLHADCVLPENAFQIIRETLKDRGIVAGAFDLSIDKAGLSFRIIEFGANLRAHMTHLLYGDQGMFLRKEIFSRIGGFADIPLMEDMEISLRLRKLGRIIFVKPPIKASARRWLEEGAVHTTLRDWTNAFLYRFLKVSPEKLIKYYRDVR
jgi:rSAM/selenodomain-associated transferase 2